MEQKRIGSVEPFGGYKNWHYIAGAILKYADMPQFHDELVNYVEKLLNKEKEKNYE